MQKFCFYLHSIRGQLLSIISQCFLHRPFPDLYRKPANDIARRLMTRSMGLVFLPLFSLNCFPSFCTHSHLPVTCEVSDPAPLHHSHQKIFWQLTSLGFFPLVSIPQIQIGVLALIPQTHCSANIKIHSTTELLKITLHCKEKMERTKSNV